jgi:hypothetical protein
VRSEGRADIEMGDIVGKVNVLVNNPAEMAVFSGISGCLASFCQNAEHAPLIHVYDVNVCRDYKRRVRSGRAARATRIQGASQGEGLMLPSSAGDLTIQQLSI